LIFSMAAPNCSDRSACRDSYKVRNAPRIS
jgi:hypothetical protein